MKGVRSSEVRELLPCAPCCRYSVRSQLALKAALSAKTIGNRRRGDGDLFEWGNDIPEMLRNATWNYALFTADKQRPGVNQAECLACHKPLENVSYTFTLKQLSQAK